MNKDGGVDLGKMGDNQDNGMVKSGIQMPDLGKLAELGKREKVEDRVALLSPEDQCYHLGRSVRCRIAPSKVHGVGVVAIRDLKKRERAHVMFSEKAQFYRVSPSTLKKHLGEVYPEVYQLILDRWPNVVNGQPFLSPNYDQRLISFMNHSDTPNYSPETDTVLCDIKAGEELFEDYRVVPHYEEAFPFLAEKPVKGVINTPKRRGKMK